MLRKEIYLLLLQHHVSKKGCSYLGVLVSSVNSEAVVIFTGHLGLDSVSAVSWQGLIGCLMRSVLIV